MTEVAVLDERMVELARALAPDAAQHSAEQRRRLVLEAMAGDPADVIWLVLSVLRAQLPDEIELDEARSFARLDGAEALLARELAALAQAVATGSVPSVAVVSGEVTVDVHHTSNYEDVSGIQRVVRETVTRWSREHRMLAVGWIANGRALRPLSNVERTRMKLPDPDPALAVADIVVPWRGVHLVPELAADPIRSPRILALARFGRVEVATIGFDCIPVTSSETIAEGVSSNFAGLLAAVRHTDRLAAISSSAALEYRGWRRMVRAAGFKGPDIVEIELPVQAAGSTPEDIEAARQLLCVTGIPMVLVVGSHEPRKNHLAVLHAAELLWREGLRFILVLVGSGAWRNEAFREAIDRLQLLGYPVEVQSALPDAALWAAYGLARCVLFPSLNEGFGLPIGESLAAGTPVITSNFGSMREIVAPDGEPRGGLLVDPHDDHAIAEALRRLLLDEGLHRRLTGEAEARVLGTWDDYAEATWAYLAQR